MARSSSYTYNPATGEWTQSTTTSSSSDSTSSSDSSSSSSSGGDNLTSSTSDSQSSTGSVEKQYNTIEINTLEGTLNFIVTKQTIKLKAGDTVKINGIGKHLSGSYYVKDITRQISSNGYSHSATLIKTDFGNSLKVSTSTLTKKVVEKKVASTPKATSSPKRTYTVKKGDCLWNIAKQFYGNGSAYTKIYDANTNQIANPSLIYPGQVFVIP